MKCKSRQLIGQVFGNWKVISLVGKKNKSHARYWLCTCMLCNLNYQVEEYSLVHGRTLNCHLCGMLSRTEDLTGKIFGKWIVLFIDKNPTKKSQNGGVKWICKCECGRQQSITSNNLRKGRSLSCASCKIKPKHFLNCVLKNAKYSNKFNIDIEYIEKIWNQQKGKCVLTDIKLKIGSRWKGEEITASLDRIDSSKGYIKDNIQWVHKIVNKMKMDLDQEEFIQICNLVAKKHPK